MNSFVELNTDGRFCKQGHHNRYNDESKQHVNKAATEISIGYAAGTIVELVDSEGNSKGKCLLPGGYTLHLKKKI